MPSAGGSAELTAQWLLSMRVSGVKALLALLSSLSLLACGEDAACPAVLPADGVKFEGDIRDEYPEAAAVRLCAFGSCGATQVRRGITSLAVTSSPAPSEGDVRVRVVVLNEARDELARLETTVTIRERQPFGPDCQIEHSANVRLEDGRL